MQVLVVKNFQGISNLAQYFNWSSLTPGKISSHVVENTLSKHWKTTKLAYILKIFEIL